MQRQIFLRLLGPAVLSVSMFIAGMAAVPAMPFSKGMVWVYEGKVSWHKEVIKHKHIRLETELLEVYSYADTQVAVVRGFPSELAWYGDHPHPKFSLLVLTQTGLYEIQTGSESQARQWAQDFGRRSRELMLQTFQLIPFPLIGGRRFRSPVKGFCSARGRKVYRSLYRTNPDHTLVEFAPGLGVVRFLYEHHGTVSFADVRLKEIRYPPKQ